jgi:hypothetical protein
MQSLAEWLLALGVLAGVAWAGAPVLQRLAPQAYAPVTLVESELPDLPGDVPDGVESVPLLMLLDGSTVRLGMPQPALHAPHLARHAAGPAVIEKGVLDNRVVLPFRTGRSRFWVVLDRTAPGEDRLVTAIYIK